MNNLNQRSFLFFTKQNFMRKVTTFKSLPRITVPQKMVQRLDKKMQKRREINKLYRNMNAKHGPVVIAAKNKKLNVHRGQVFNEMDKNTLISHGWKHYKSKGDFFTIQNLGNIPALRNIGTQTFEDLGLNDSLTDLVSSTGIKTPVKIQCEAIPELLSGNNVVCTAETGSGKTLAYILPIIQHILDLKENVSTCFSQPLALILVPTRELVDQLQSVILPFATPLSLQVKTQYSGHGKNTKIDGVCDILISTPGACMKAVKYGGLNLVNTRHIVLDEADTLLDDSFNPYVNFLLKENEFHISNTHSPEKLATQIILVSATVPRDLIGILGDLVPVESFTKVSTPFLHKLPPHIIQKFTRIGPDDRPGALLKIAKSNFKTKVPTIVFCNKSTTAHWMGYFLEANKIPHILLTGVMPNQIREGCFRKFQDGENDILVTTDVASRGLDTIRAQHVVNYECPLFMSDYIHRVGRIGRLGSKSTCFAVNYVSYKYDVELVWQIETAARKAAELHNVNANIKRKLVSKAVKEGKEPTIDLNDLPEFDDSLEEDECDAR